MTTDLFVSALGCLGVAVVFDLVVGTTRPLGRVLPYVLSCLASAAFVAVGARALTHHPSTVAFRALAVRDGALRFDHLSGLFLTFLFALAFAISLVAVSWSWRGPHGHRRGAAAAYALALSAIALVVVAADVFDFLFAWEMLALSFFVLTSAGRRSRRQTSGAWVTATFAKFGGACVLFGLLLLAARSGSLSMTAWHHVSGATLDVAWLTLVVGFAAKLGVAPFQVWLPVGYPAARGPARALLAGVASNVAVYALWRVMSLLAPPPTWLVVLLLLFGGVTALLGATFAGVQSRLSRVVAYSSVENAGLIVVGFGVALTGELVHSVALSAVGLLAATLQALSHGVAKSALFGSLAAIEEATGTDDLDALRGVGRSMRWSGAAFAAGSLTLAGLPPTIGFVSEWFLLESLMQQFRVPGLALRLALLGAGALVALTAGLAVFVFVRVLGLTILGRPSGEVAPLRDHGVSHRAGLLLLGGATLALAAASPLEFRYLARGLSPVVAERVTEHALRSPWVLQPVFAGFSILSPSWLWIVLPGFIAIVFLAVQLLSRGRFARPRRVASWHSATSGVSGASAYTAFGFANPLRHVLANVLGARREVRTLDSESVQGGPRFEELTRVIEPVEAYVYRPLRRAALTLAALAKRLQSGNLNAYVAYMLVVLLALLAVTAALH